MAFTLYGGRAIWDAAGRFTQASRPAATTVFVNASQAAASRIGLVPGVFTFTRAGDTSADLVVNFSLGGTATGGVDYQSSPASLIAPTVTIPAGQSSAVLTITPKAATYFVGSQNIVLALASSSAYALGNPGSANITLAGNTVPGAALRVTSPGATITWRSTTGAVYRVAYKNNLTDPAWTTASGDITASTSTTSWLDAGAANANQRFYIVAQVR
jgi:hypothetical protein